VSVPTLTLSTNGLIDAIVGSPYIATVTATGGTAPYSYSIISGVLVTDLHLNSNTGEISGTPSVIEQTSFAIEAKDAYGFKVIGSYSLEVKQTQPIAQNSNISVKANGSVELDLTQGAIGGPFTGADVVSMSPSNAGTVTIRKETATSKVRSLATNTADTYILTFTPSRTFNGNAVIRYTLSNTVGTSAAATVTFSVASRDDLSKDPEVIGLVSAQANAAKRFASTQISNFSNRLESLHGDGRNGSKFGLNVAVNKAPSNNTEVQDQFSISPSVLKQQTNSENQKTDSGSTETEKSAFFDTTTADYQPWAIWVNGTINYGRATQEQEDSEYRFTTNGISAGVDYRLNDFMTLGTGVGFGHDNSRIGNNGSKSTADSVSAIIYSSLRPIRGVFLDSLVGYGTLDFDSKRYITNDGGFAVGSRDGQYYFGAISTGMEFYRTSWMWSPYSRLEISRAELNPFVETASDFNAIKYFKQNVSTLNGVVGFRGQGEYPVLWGKLTPKVRVEYTHRLQDDDKAKLAYADLADLGSAYQINSLNTENSNWMIGLGSGLILKNEIELNMEYGTNIDRDAQNSRSIQLGVNFPF
ncbi:MAG: autotransporter domain-containing protein, partial [Acinetobacter sp.]